MSQSNEEYNRRQYNLMLRTIDEFQNGGISFRKLVDDLEALQSTLEDAPESWVSRFESLWGKLEDTNAVMLDESRREFNDFDRQLVARTAAELDSLIRTELL